jgi:hypothetical protein
MPVDMIANATKATVIPTAMPIPALSAAVMGRLNLRDK